MNTRLLITCLAAASLLLAACGNESATETTSSASPTSNAVVAAASSAASSETAPSETVPPTPAESTPALAPPPPASAEATAAQPLPPAVTEAGAPIDARSPDEIVAGAGERGQRYLAALRLAGIPPSGMDSAEILYADGTCNAIAQGMPRSEVLAEFKAVGDVYAQVTPMPSQRIAEIYVETAENTYC
ncbi:MULTISPECIES: DUF732 domain-containing protein [Rhodococcus]|uniref:DUF732 domain-containing protein n=1 Tax=Rhodococcus globerulus TaxID=33008 RepID=UPI001C58DAAD|nr:DUF732 domain-containing protein [Rhodococcus globerulus]QXW00641.1 DUF732 domain-containing protein [Rhodococcus globerulus]